MRAFPVAISVLAAACAPVDRPSDPVDDGPAMPRIPWLAAAGGDGVGPVEIPWLAQGSPVRWACPAGWRERPAAGATVCDPFPEAGPAACPPGQMHVPGDPGCTPVGRACGDDPFPDVSDAAEDTAVLYVSQAADAGGTGGPDDPHRTLAAALAAARPGTLIALAAGSYEVDRDWPDGVSVRGRCARDTALAVATDTARAAVLVVDTPTQAVRVEDVSIGPSDVAGVVARGAGATLTLEGVEIAQTRGDAGLVVVDAASVRATGLVVRGTRPDGEEPVGAFDAPGGWGVAVGPSARLVLRRALLDDNAVTGLALLGAGASVELADAVIRRTTGAAGAVVGGVYQGGGRLVATRVLIEGNAFRGWFLEGEDSEAELADVVVRRNGAPGIVVSGGAALSLAGVLLEANRARGLMVIDGATSTAEDLVVLDTREAVGGRMGVGLIAWGRAHVDLRRAYVARTWAGIAVYDAETRLVASDLRVRDTRRLTLGVGLEAADGGRVELQRAVLDGHVSRGLALLGRGSEAVVTDLVVRDIRPDDEGRAGYGLLVDDGSELEVERGLVERAHEAAVLVDGPGSRVMLHDFWARDTESEAATGRRGRGIAIQFGGQADLARVLLERNRDVGLFVGWDGSRATIADLIVRDTLPRRLDGSGGTGVVVQDDAEVELERGLLERNLEVGIYADDGARAELRSLRVVDTLDSPCRGECPPQPPGVALGVYDRAVVDVRDFLLARSLACGLQLGRANALALEDGAITDNAIGVCLQSPDLPIRSVLEGARLEANGTNIESTTFDVPTPSR